MVCVTKKGHVFDQEFKATGADFKEKVKQIAGWGGEGVLFWINFKEK